MKLEAADQARTIGSDSDSATAELRKIRGRAARAGLRYTLGNSLRRILLSSLQGAAITSVRIEGVQHEFSTIPGVVEDVTDIVLNLKEVQPLRRILRSRARSCIEAKGPKKVYASDIRPDATWSPQQGPPHLRALRNAKLRMEMAVRMGKGYVRPSATRGGVAPIGTIPIDAIFSPVRKINFTVNQRPRGAADRLRPARARGLDGRLHPPRRRGGLRGQDPQGPAHRLHQLRRRAEMPDETWRSSGKTGRTSTSTNPWRNSSSPCGPSTA